MTPAQICDAQKKDPSLKKIKTIALIVPQQYLKMFTKLAHKSVMAGHLADQNNCSESVIRILWSGIASDIKRLCQSCDICQRIIPKGKIIKASLGRCLGLMYHLAVAMDLVGPVEPCKNRYILTLVDYATR